MTHIFHHWICSCAPHMQLTQPVLKHWWLWPQALDGTIRALAALPSEGFEILRARRLCRAHAYCGYSSQCRIETLWLHLGCVLLSGVYFWQKSADVFPAFISFGEFGISWPVVWYKISKSGDYQYQVTISKKCSKCLQKGYRMKELLFYLICVHCSMHT